MTDEEYLNFLKDAKVVVNGDLVGNKHVEHEIGNVEAGGIGIQINNNYATPAPGTSDPLEEQLKPIFKGNLDEVRKFLKGIQAPGTKPTAITSMVNQLIKDEVVIPNMCYQDLWEPLYDKGLYTCSKANWNSQIAK